MHLCIKETLLLCLKTPCPPRLKTRGDKFWDQNYHGGFFSPADQNELYHTPSLYEIWGSQNKVLNMEERGEPSQADNSKQKKWRQYRSTPAPTAETLCLNQISQSSVNKNAIAFIECPCLTLNVKCLLFVRLWGINCFVFTKNLEQQ